MRSSTTVAQWGVAVATWFCLACFEEIEPSAVTCLARGAPAREAASDHEEGLIRALPHPKLPDRQVLAATILGRRRSVKAVPELIALVRGKSTNPYLAAEAVTALGLIGDPRGDAIVRELTDSPRFMVRRAACEALEARKG